MPGIKYYEDLKTTQQWEEHQNTLKHVYNTPKSHSPQYPQKDYEKTNPKDKLKRKPEWTAADQALEDSLWDE